MSLQICDRGPGLRGHPENGRCHAGAEAGFTLAMFLMVIAVMSIMMGAAVQTVEFQMQREREAELIFRGRQYVEAIRLYKAKYGRNPMRMKEIWEAKPRVVRKKWKDPITDSEKWGLVFVGEQNQGQGRRIAGGGVVPTGTPRFGSDARADDPRRGPGGDRGFLGGGPGQRGPGQGGPEGERVGPIVGVHSTSCEESIKVYEGRTSYCEWKFVLKDEQQQQPGRGGAGQGPGRPTDDGTGWHPGDPVPTFTPPPTFTPAGGHDDRRRTPSYGTTPTPRP